MSGLVGTEIELLLLKHYDEPAQLIPVLLIAGGVAVLVWHARRPHGASRRVVRIVMGLFLLAGFLGMGLHFHGAAEFQLETNPQIGKWELIKKVMRAQAPPVLAPGQMLQLGLLGLLYSASDSRDVRDEMT